MTVETVGGNHTVHCVPPRTTEYQVVQKRFRKPPWSCSLGIRTYHCVCKSRSLKSTLSIVCYLVSSS